VRYVRRGDDFITLAMNGWDPAQPAWWLNLEASGLATIDLPNGSMHVRAARAEGIERDELWRLCAAIRGWGDGLDRFARLRPSGTDVVILHPVTG
jgi:hypothetical protein